MDSTLSRSPTEKLLPVCMISIIDNQVGQILEEGGGSMVRSRRQEGDWERVSGFGFRVSGFVQKRSLLVFGR